jgi:hypothetical protein
MHSLNDEISCKEIKSSVFAENFIKDLRKNKNKVENNDGIK